MSKISTVTKMCKPQAINESPIRLIKEQKQEKAVQLAAQTSDKLIADVSLKMELININ